MGGLTERDMQEFARKYLSGPSPDLVIPLSKEVIMASKEETREAVNRAVEEAVLGPMRDLAEHLERYQEGVADYFEREYPEEKE